jgi:CBS domain-containing protein
MVEWGVEFLPVLDRDGLLAGLFGVEQALRAALRDQDAAQPEGAAGPGDGAVRDADPPTPVSLVMQRAVPTIAAQAPLLEMLRQLLAAPERFLVVLDAGRPAGTLTDLGLAGTLAEPLRSAWLAALRSPATPLPAVLEGAAELTAGGLADPVLPSISAQATQDEALRLMLAGAHERLLVLDEAGRLAGLLARRGLLLALSQSNAS